MAPNENWHSKHVAMTHKTNHISQYKTANSYMTMEDQDLRAVEHNPTTKVLSPKFVGL